jgi:hypothetical protein
MARLGNRPAPPQRRRPCALRAAYTACSTGTGDICVMPSLAPVIKLWGQRGLSTMAAPTAYARGCPHAKCHGDCYRTLVNCDVKVMLSASGRGDPLSTRPSASNTSTPSVGAAPWLPPAAYAPIEKSCSARPNGWPSTAISAIYRIFPATPATPPAPLHACFFPVCTITSKDGRYC